MIYEVVWFQLLQLVIGSSAVSLGVLLGTFMGGMCLGSFLLPRYVGSGQHPLRVYAFLELGIGAMGLLLLFGMPLVNGLYTHRRAAASCSARSSRRVCLLPPTLLMGATLPAIARWVETTPRGVSWLGFFYGGNIGGAVIGSLLAGFYLLRVYDMAVATYVAVALNVRRRGHRPRARAPDGSQPHEPARAERAPSYAHRMRRPCMWRSRSLVSRRSAARSSGRGCCR